MKDEFNFEAALGRLTEINEILSDGKISLDESMKLFREGIELTEKCKAVLEKARKEIDEAQRDE